MVGLLGGLYGMAHNSISGALSVLLTPTTRRAHRALRVVNLWPCTVRPVCYDTSQYQSRLITSLTDWPTDALGRHNSAQSCCL